MSAQAATTIRADAADGRSTELDLANWQLEWMEALVCDVFARAIACDDGHYAHVKFIVGGGKKTRGKYEEETLKVMTTALREVGYEDDRGASACAECQGTYKYQHDTDKDLKYLHVFPRVTHASREGGEEMGSKGATASPEHRACACDLSEFKRLVEMYTPSFSQKRALLRRMKVMEQALSALEQKVIAMEQLSDREQKMYDSMREVASKIEFLQGALDDMIKKGRLTKGEQDEIVDDLTSKVKDIELMMSEANEESKPKKVEVLLAKKDMAQKKIDSVLGKPPIVYTVPHERELADLKKELNSLKKLQSESKGKLMSGADAAKCAKMPALEERIANLESNDDKGWYEDECRELLFPPKAAPKAVVKTVSASSGSKNAGWLSKASTGGARPSAKSNAAAKTTVANPFASLGDD